jgi:tetratricopeptide (TPR) repeat protein
VPIHDVARRRRSATASAPVVDTTPNPNFEKLKVEVRGSLKRAKAEYGATPGLRRYTAVKVSKQKLNEQLAVPGRLLEDGEYAAAIGAFEKLTTEDLRATETAAWHALQFGKGLSEGLLALKNGNPTEALAKLESVQGAAPFAPPGWAARAENAKGVAFSFLGEKEEAKVAYANACRIGRENNKLDVVTTAVINQANDLVYDGYFERALAVAKPIISELEQLIPCVRDDESTGKYRNELVDNLAYANATVGRALSYKPDPELEQAEQYLDQALKATDGLTKTTGKTNWNSSSIRCDLALLELKRGDPDTAKTKYADQAEKMAAKLKDKNLQAEVQETFGKIDQAKGQPKEAVGHFTKAKHLYKEIEDEESAAKMDALIATLTCADL